MEIAMKSLFVLTVLCLLAVFSYCLCLGDDGKPQEQTLELVRADVGVFGNNRKRKVMIQYAVPTSGKEDNAYLICFAKTPESNDRCRFATFGHRESPGRSGMKIDLGIVVHPVSCMQLFYDYHEPNSLELGPKTLDLHKGRIIFCDKDGECHQLQEKIPVAELKEIDKLEAYFIGLEQRLYSQFRDSFPPETTRQGE